MNLEKQYEDFIKHGIYLRNWSKKTVRTYRQGLNAFQTSLRQSETGGSLHIEGVPSCNGHELTKSDLDTFVIWMRERGLTAGGCNMYIRTVNSFLSWLHEEGLLEQKLKIKVLSSPAKPLKGFSDGEVRLLLNCKPKSSFETRTWVLALVLFDTGLRIEEALTIERAKVDLDELTIRVLGKGNKERVVPFSLELRRHLYRYLSKTSGRFVFATFSGQRLTYRNAYRDIKNLLRKAGIEGQHVHPHNFRHFFAVSYIRRGGDLYRLSRILGHTSVKTTEIYLRSMTAEQIGEGHLSPLAG